MKIALLAGWIVYALLVPNSALGDAECSLDLDESAERAGLIKLEDVADRRLADLSGEARGYAEVASVDYHQGALLRTLSMSFFTSFGLGHRSARNTREGIVKSDMGKLAVFKKWWTDPASRDGELMMNALKLQGKGPLANLLRRLNSGKPFVNQKISNELLREIMAKVPMLQGYFHEFPGMREAERALVEKKITWQDFVEQIEAIYAHNGPGDPGFSHEGGTPFWANVPSMALAAIRELVAKQKNGEDGLPPEALKIFEGTIFEQADGTLRYPDPVSLSGFLHMIEDRFDGYRDSRKIRNEVRFFPPIVAEVDMMFNTNFLGTRAALVYDRDVLLPRLVRNGVVPSGEGPRIVQMITERIQRMEAIRGQFARRVVGAENLLQKLANKEPIESITIRLDAASGNGATREFSASELGDGFSDAAQSFREFIDREVRVPVMGADER